MDRVQKYNGVALNFQASPKRILNDSKIIKIVSNFKKKVLNTKITGDFEKDMQQYANMQAESNKILHNIIEASKEKTITYDCAKTQIQQLNNLNIL